MEKVFIVAADLTAQTAKVVVGQFGLNLMGWFELVVAAIALATLIYWVVKLVLAIPLVKHLAAAAMGAALVMAVLATLDVLRLGFGLDSTRLGGAALAAAGICLVLSIRRSRREAKALEWTRSSPLVVEETTVSPGGEETVSYHVSSKEEQSSSSDERLATLERELEEMRRRLGAAHRLPEPPDEV